ncbi:SIS domain-containing protein [Zhouia amylolytica]|nr:SIS domain-containing protein [Zhouia amylolytica]
MKKLLEFITRHIIMSENTINKIDLYTGPEIFGQPTLWETTYNLIKEEKSKIENFLLPLLEKQNLKIILTGAGSSAFIGEAAQGLVQKATKRSTQAIATTDIVTHPELFLLKNNPTLLVSFARSGNSPESVETVNLANTHCDDIYHLIITCNKDGKLAKYGEENTDNSCSLVLPEASNDKSLAMTGSFTSMLLSILLVSDIQNINENEASVKEVSSQGSFVLENNNALAELTSTPFERVVFLGSGPMLGVARESHLKLQELTDGQVICKHDSFLGFRHGPRAVVNEKTLVVYLFATDEHVLKYEKDLVKDIATDPRNIKTIAYGDIDGVESDLTIKNNTNTDLHIVAATVVGQLLGYNKSLQLGLNPDNPSVSGSISRVVQGVNIYKNS